MRRGAVTIKDVAEAAGVHTSTVSRALSPATRHLISAEIATRIDGVAKELGYARNAIASSLRTRRSMTVGVLIPDITNPLFPPMLRGIEDALGGEFTAIIANTDNDPEREAIGARRLLARSVDGLIMATVRRRDGISDELAAAGVPIVLVNRTADQSEVATVVADDAQGIRLMVEHLAELGHRRIAHLAGPQDLSTGAVRQRAFREAMRARKLDADDQKLVAAKAYSIAEGARLTEQLLRSSPAADRHPHRQRPLGPGRLRGRGGAGAGDPGRPVGDRLQRHAVRRPADPAADHDPHPALRDGRRGGPPAAAAAGTARGARHVGPARRPAGRARLHGTAARGRLIR